MLLFRLGLELLQLLQIQLVDQVGGLLQGEVLALQIVTVSVSQQILLGHSLQSLLLLHRGALAPHAGVVHQVLVPINYLASLYLVH